MWYNKIMADISNIPDFITYYEQELIKAKLDCKVGGLVEKNIKDLPGVTEQRFNQLQEIEAVLNYLNIKLRKIHRTHFQKYLEAYGRALSSRDAEKYTEGEDEVIDFETMINCVALIRNQYLGILKGLESKSFALNNITKLRCAGMENVSL